MLRKNLVLDDDSLKRIDKQRRRGNKIKSVSEVVRDAIKKAIPDKKSTTNQQENQ